MSQGLHRVRIGGRTTGPPPVRVPVPRSGRSRPTGPTERHSPGAQLTRIGTWSLLTAVVAVFVLLVVIPMTGAYRVSVVLSNSMAPKWHAGDMVVVTPQTAADVRVGQVISYNPPVEGRPSITHRVIAVTEPGPHPIVTTKGDANDTADEWGPVRLASDRVWLVRGSIPQAGHVLAFLQGQALALLTTVLAPIAFLVVILVRIWRPNGTRS